MILNSLSLDKIKWVGIDEFRTNCHICDDKKLHCYVNVTKRIWYCFKCTCSGKFINNSFLVSNKTFDLFKNKNLSIVDPTSEHIQYLIQRGCSLHQIFMFNPISIKEYPLYVFSTYSNTHLIGRYICEDNLYEKYMKINYNPYMPYGYEYIKYKPDVLCIVEGIFDLLAVIEYIPSTIALLGKTMSAFYRSFIESIKPKCIKILLDSDAKEHADVIYKKCRFIADTQCIVLPFSDPWSLKDDIKKYLF